MYEKFKISWLSNLPSGASIVLFAAALFFLSLLSSRGQDATNG